MIANALQLSLLASLCVACALPQRVTTRSAMGAVPPLEPEQPTERGTSNSRLALVIGNSAYRDRVPALQNPVNDATDIADKLESLGFTVERVYDGTLAQIDAARERFSEHLRTTKGLGVFFFAGHGLQVDGVNYLVPVDATLTSERSIVRETFAASDILEDMHDARQGINIVILDACRDNPFVQAGKRSVRRGLAVMNAADGTLIAYSTGPGATASDGEGRNGVYSGALIEHLGDEGLTIEQVLKKTAASVRSLTAGAQLPWTATNMVEDVFLNPRKPATPEQLLELAHANYKGGEYLSVVNDMSRLLAEGSGTPAQRADAEHLRREADARLASLKLIITPNNATFRMDGSTYRSHDGDVRIDPGDHRIEVVESGYRPYRQSLHLEAGQAETVKVSLAKRSYWLAWTVGGVSAAALTTSLVTGLVARSKSSELRDHCGSDRECPRSYDYKPVKQSGERFAHTSDALLAVGAAGAVGALAVVLVPQWFEKRKGEQRAGLSCARAGCVAHARWSF